MSHEQNLLKQKSTPRASLNRRMRFKNLITFGVSNVRQNDNFIWK